MAAILAQRAVSLVKVKWAPRDPGPARRHTRNAHRHRRRTQESPVPSVANHAYSAGARHIPRLPQADQEPCTVGAQDVGHLNSSRLSNKRAAHGGGAAVRSRAGYAEATDMSTQIGRPLAGRHPFVPAAISGQKSITRPRIQGDHGRRKEPRRRLLCAAVTPRRRRGEQDSPCSAPVRLSSFTRWPTVPRGNRHH
jgi:hypothetical protein